MAVNSGLVRRPATVWERILGQMNIARTNRRDGRRANLDSTLPKSDSASTFTSEFNESLFNLAQRGFGGVEW